MCIRLNLSVKTRVNRLDICSPDTSNLSDSSSSSEDNGGSDDDSDGGEPVTRFCFPELTQDIRRVISSYGAVFPKLNWTSPRVR